MQKQILPSILAFIAISGFSTYQYNSRSLAAKISGGVGVAASLAALGTLSKKYGDDIEKQLTHEYNTKAMNLNEQISQLHSKNEGLKVDLELSKSEKIKLESDWKLRLENSMNVLKAEISKREKIIKDKESELENLNEQYNQEFSKLSQNYNSKIAEHNKQVQEFYDWKKAEEETMRNARFMLDKRHFESNSEHKEQLEIDRKQLREWERNLLEAERQLNEKEASFIAQQKDYQYQMEQQTQIIAELNEQLQRAEAEKNYFATQLSELEGGLNPESLEHTLVSVIRQCVAGYGFNIAYKQIENRSITRISFLFDAANDDKDEIIKQEKNLSADKFGGKEVTVKRKNGYLEIDVPFESQTVNQKKVEFVPGLPRLEDIEEFLGGLNHLLLVGATGDGKSTLVANLLEVASRLLSGVPELVILNPKPTAVHYKFNGKVHRPDFMNLDQPEGCSTPDVNVGLNQILSDLKERMALGQMAIENDEEFPVFVPRIYLLEEAPTMNNECDDYQEVVELAARLGREYNFILFVLGQESTIKQYGFNSRSFVQNFSRCYLKSALNTDVVDTAEIKFLPDAEGIRKDIQHHKENVSSNKSTQYYGLFIHQGSHKGFVSYLPAPDYYIEGEEMECVSCGSTHIKKDGKRDGNQYYRCGDCDKQFSQSQWESYRTQQK